mmetsp:Transcript_33881/g.68636  ORF Transcript_33881/g.68636 Transcript_33881/m.68636 type:complete len:287 (+) Transcript_33881:116-976(+)|eukprot:CAMPEP_0202854532 /NCGR_PEP_ID=MMETSP1389-20130828/91052_1 /ASSEMBLY_ACC=CAM_ASM_000865 /TAXON_ID=302021 /ORGANISM="Rhodomonas sp., Strain CCMP768" /LENGTH=286 /DNA_ID=CAMNT_0049533127 /DNA_START=71 /DNA_END=931 /DNA_ORIENTATION=-
MPIRKSASTVRVATLAQVAMEDIPSAARPVAVSFPSRYIPLFGLCLASVGIFGSVLLNRLHGHEIGGIPWPYISDTAKDPPQAGMFAFTMTVTSCIIALVVIINYGKAKNDIEIIFPPDMNNLGAKRNLYGLIVGLISAPNLGLLACYDTKRTPGLHLLFVILFFLPCIAYLFIVKSLYELLLHRANTAEKKSDDGSLNPVPYKSYTSLQTSLRWKRLICNVFLVAVTLYLPVGMSLVSDWQDYSNDVAIHTARAVAQHVSVLCLCCFFGSMYFDFGDLEFFIVQG